MGIRINAYNKDNACIVGQVKALGLYEVDLDGIEAFKLKDEPIQFWSGDIYLITEVRRMSEPWEMGFSSEDFLFYSLAPNYYSGQGLRSENDRSIGVMFDPNILKKPIDLLVEKSDLILSGLISFLKDEIEKNEEVKKLKDFKELIYEAIQKDAIVSIIIS